MMALPSFRASLYPTNRYRKINGKHTISIWLGLKLRLDQGILGLKFLLVGSRTHEEYGMQVQTRKRLSPQQPHPVVGVRRFLRQRSVFYSRLKVIRHSRSHIEGDNPRRGVKNSFCLRVHVREGPRTDTTDRDWRGSIWRSRCPSSSTNVFHHAPGRASHR